MHHYVNNVTYRSEDLDEEFIGQKTIYREFRRLPRPGFTWFLFCMNVKNDLVEECIGHWTIYRELRDELGTL